MLFVHSHECSCCIIFIKDAESVEQAGEDDHMDKEIHMAESMRKKALITGGEYGMVLALTKIG